MLEIKHPITGERLQVAENDFEEKMNWQQAKIACNELENGWRLPTKTELELMYSELYERGNGNFKTDNESYWSGSEGNDNDAWFFGFDVGFAYYASVYNTYYVRAVRII